MNDQELIKKKILEEMEKLLQNAKEGDMFLSWAYEHSKIESRVRAIEDCKRIIENNL